MSDGSAGDIVRDVSTAVALIEGDAGVRDVLGVVARLEPVGVRKISRASDLPVPIVAAVCGELRKRGVIAAERPVRLTPAGRSLFGFDSRLARPDAEWTFGRNEGDRLNELETVAERLTRVAGAAPRARVEIDQAHCTVATKLRRVLLLHETGALLNRRVLLLGDDDLISVAMNHFARHYGLGGWMDELTVVDVDPAVLDFCRSELKDASFPVRFVQHDLRMPLPSDLTNSVDTVLTDPPYTPDAAELFLSRAASALSEGSGRHVFLCFGMKSPHVSLRIQSAIVAMGFVIRQLIRNFNEYLGAGSLGGSSHLYHLTSTNHTKPLIQAPYAGHLYTGDHGAARRFRCSACGAVEEVGGPGPFRTVGELKRNRCPACGGSSFRPLPRTSPERRSLRVDAEFDIM
jgi:N4-bis(aminopropyl)spermidine synthase